MKSRPTASVLLPALLGGALFLGGCGGFSSGNAPGLEPPPPPEFAKPETQGRVMGTLRVRPDFLSELAVGLSLEEVREAPEDPGSAPGDEEPSEEEPRDPESSIGNLTDVRGPSGAGDVYHAMEVELVGVRRRRVGEVGQDGSFSVEPLPQGDYEVRVHLQERELARFPVQVLSRETTRISLGVLGFDLADLDGDGSQEDLTVRLEVSVGGRAGDATRIVEPDGSVRARLPTGATEYLLPGGVVRREEPGGGASFRRDHDLDGIEDALDPDYRRLRKKPTRPSEEALLLGDAFPPLLRNARVSGPFGVREPEDLMLFQVEAARGFGAEPEEVEASLHARDGEVYRFRLRDDGGLADLSPTWPGHQPSGDLVAGDGVFSHLLPIDPGTRPLLFGRQVVVQARDGQGRPSNRVTFFLDRKDLESRPGEVGSAALHPWRMVRGLEYLVGPSGGILAQFEASPQLAGAVATLLGPAGFRRVFAPASRSGSDGWQGFETHPAPMGGNGIYYVVVGVPGGPVFFAGRVLDRELLRATRTGG